MNYSTAQMDDFYSTLYSGRVKPSAVMNYIQHLYIAKRCAPRQLILDACCGRGLLIPVLSTYAPEIRGYVGLDISRQNLAEARIRISQRMQIPFPCNFVEGDVSRPPFRPETSFDVIAYTSSVEHLDRENGLASLIALSQLLAEDGVMFLSTPRTAGPTPRKLQYKVHVYEWDKEEIEQVLRNCGLRVIHCVGLLPPAPEVLDSAVLDKFGQSALSWIRNMRESVPLEFLTPILAASFPEVALEILYVCRKDR